MDNRAAPGPSVILPCADWAQALDRVAQFFATPADPFVTDTLVVPSFGHGRYIAQHIGLIAGVSAGIAMLTPAQLSRRLLSDQTARQWGGTGFVLAIAEELGATLDFAQHGANLLRSYMHRCPAMLEAWINGTDTGPEGTPLPASQIWQPQLWRNLQQRLGPWPHPTVAQLQGMLSDTGGRLAALLVAPPPPAERLLVDALLQSGAPVWALRTGPDDAWPRYSSAWPAGWPLAGAVAGPATLLGVVKSQLATGQKTSVARVADASIRIHASHGPNRQVQVLRDVLCSIFDEISDLEPRDVLVLCPDIDRYAPLLDAAFDQASSHPAGRLRLRAPRRDVNGLVQGLIDALALGDSRATADDMLAWCRRPGVALRFQLTPDDLDRLEALIAQSGVVWGLDAAQRAQAGLAVRDGTWLDGVQRLVLALATDNVLTGAVPAAGVRSEDADVIGALSELVSRLRRALLESSTPAPLRIWAGRLQQMTGDLFAVDSDTAWCLEQLNATLADWAGQPSDVALTHDEVASLLGPLSSRFARSTEGNGSLTVHRLGELQGVGFRVVCVLGLDDARFPVRGEMLADDLLAGSPENARQRSRTQLRDALMAASDAFVVITQGADERTGGVLPAPVTILDLLSLCAVPGPAGEWLPGPVDGASLVHRHSLQPYAWAEFATDGDRPPSSYDQRALLSARRLAEPPPKPALPAWHQFAATPGTNSTLSLDDVESCLDNPARFLLRQACGLTLADAPQPGDGQLPTGLDSLGRWSLGQALYDDIVAGTSPAEAQARALATPGCPPGRLGAASVAPLLCQAQELATAVLACGGIDDARAIGLEFGGVRLGGTVALRGGTVVVARFGRLKPQQLVTCWVRLLALASSGTEHLVGHVIASTGHRLLEAPAPARARVLLGQIAELAARGAHELVPLPVDTSAALMGVLDGSPDGAGEVFAGRFGEGKHPAWRMLLGEPSLTALQRVGPPSLGELSALLWLPIIAGLK